MPRVTGFWESRTPEGDPEVLTTIKPIEVEDLLERLRERLSDASPGTLVRVDLIVWGD
jgi:hypothetical protein